MWHKSQSGQINNCTVIVRQTFPERKHVMLKGFLGFGWNVAKHGDGQSENDSWICAVGLDVEINGEMQTQLVLELIKQFLEK